jgi:iron complex transport system permease protein
VAGVLVQGVFHNPLASPSVLGVTSGAALGGKLALLGHALLWASASRLPFAPDMLVPLGCMAGAVLALAVLTAIARRIHGKIALLLAGFLLSSLFLSLGSFVITLGQGRWELGRALIGFTLGGVSGAGLRQVLLALPIVVIGVGASIGWSRSLDALLSGETEAAALGVDTTLAKRCCIGWCALLSAGAVCVGGNVSFVGLIVPHALRPLLGEAHGPLLPASALAGGAFLVVCDVLTRLPPNGTELPLGVVTGLIGAPLFFVLLVRSMPHE